MHRSLKMTLALGILALLGTLHSAKGQSYVFAGKIGKETIDDGKGIHPQGVAVDRNGNIFVLDTLDSRIVQWDKSNDFVRTFGDKGKKTNC